MKSVIFLIIFFSSCISSFSQDTARSKLRQMVAIVKERNAALGIEKIYLQMDKPAYTTGDTMWLKAYLFEATYLSASFKSGVIYIEIADQSNSTMERPFC